MAIFYFCFFLDLFFYYVLTCITDISRERLIKFNRALFLLMVGAPSVAGAAGTDFNMAAQLLSAARNGNTRLMQNLINSGADVNYVDSTGVSVVCTAVMNNDMRAVQLLQMYGADASQCDRQIKNYRVRNTSVDETGLFSGLSPTHKLVLGSVGAIGAIAGILWATDAFDSDGGGDSFTSTGNHGSGSGGSGNGGTSGLTPMLTVPYSPAYLTNGVVNPDASVSANDWVETQGQRDFSFMQASSEMQNYLLISRGYNLFANRYNGQLIFRDAATHAPLAMTGVAAEVGGGTPATVALITTNGIDNSDGSLARAGGIAVALSTSGAVTYYDKYKNYQNSGCDGTSCSGTEITSFDLSGHNTAVENTTATARDNNIAKIVAGWLAGGRADGDYYGFIPYGTLAVYRTGGAGTSYLNYQAMKNAISNSSFTPDVIANASQNLNSLTMATYDTLETMDDIASTGQLEAFQHKISNWYGTGQGLVADDLFASYNIASPIIVNSVGGYNTANYASGTGVDATFENYAPIVYSDKIDKNFMSVVAVQHSGSTGTSGATSVSGYGDGTAFGKIRLSMWTDENNSSIVYRSRMCGISGTGNSSIDPWCFAAPGENSEYAVSAMAGAVASLKKSFDYMSNQEIFNLLALTADGPFLAKDSNGDWFTKDNLVAYLKTKYTISNQSDGLNGDLYLNAFLANFGYGLINLERATTPGQQIYYFSDGNIVSSNKVFWDSLRTSSLRGSGVFGARGATIPVAAYDVLSSSDGAMSVMRQWNTDVSLGGDASHGLYLGDTLAELKTRDVDNSVTVGNFKFGLARSERAYDDNMSGLDSLSIAWNNDRFGFKSGYQHYLTDGAGRFSGLSNPVLALTSNAVSNAVELKSGRVSVSGRAFVGNITTDGLLENDPAVSNNFAAAKLGDAMGAESGLSVRGEKLSIATKVGTMHETKTVLGTAGYGFLDLGGADTRYIDSTVKYAFNDGAKLTLRGTYAWTQARDVADGVINGLSELKSNAFAAGVNLGNFDLTVSMPLALVSGEMRYSVADVALDDNGALVVNSLGERSIDLTPETREYRLNASYRHQFGEWTDGALGFIYRVNPNNTDAFGNESIFMMKLSHRLGI